MALDKGKQLLMLVLSVGKLQSLNKVDSLRLHSSSVEENPKFACGCLRLLLACVESSPASVVLVLFYLLVLFSCKAIFFLQFSILGSVVCCTCLVLFCVLSTFNQSPGFTEDK